MSYGLSLTAVPKDLYYVERKLVADQAAEIERLRLALVAAKTWFDSSTGEKISLRDAEIADQIDAALGHQQITKKPPRTSV